MTESHPLILNPQDNRWLEFIQSNPQASPFHHPAWMELLTHTYGYKGFILAVTGPENRICAGIPIMEINSLLTGRRWVSLPFTDHCIPLYHDEDALRQLTMQIDSAIEERHVPRLQLKWEYPPHPSLRGHSEFVLHRLRLSTDIKEVVCRIKHKQFRQIKVAEERGVRIEKSANSEFVENFYRLHLQTRRRKGVPVQPRRFFRHLEQEILRTGLGFILLAFKDRQCVAGAVFLHWNKTLIYKYSASNEIGRQSLAMDLLLWNAITWACANGFHWMDMGRTDNENEGLRNFKLRWGAEETPLIYSELPANAPRQNGSRLAPLMKSVITQSPAAISKLLGELLYRHFG
jgi:CelD/BcsL family acetyltransferase involved in cellulose biosynthesis